MLIQPINLYFKANLYSQKPSFQGKTTNIPTEKVLTMINDGKHVRQIAKELKISVHTYYQLLRDRGIEYKKKTLPAKLEKITKEQLENFHKMKMSISEICEELKIGDWEYRRLLNYYSIMSPKKALMKTNKAITKEQLQECVDKYNTVEERSKALNITNNMYFNLIQKFNIETPYKSRVKEVSNVTAEQILQLQKEGKSTKEIIKILNISQGIYNDLINRAGIVTALKESKQIISEITKERLEGLINSGKKVKEICEELQISERTYSRLIDKFGIVTKRKKGVLNNKKITKEMLQTLVDQKLTPDEICEKLNLSKPNFYKMLKILDINYDYLHHANEKIVSKRELEEAISTGKTVKEISEDLSIGKSTYHFKAKVANVETALRKNIDTINAISKEEIQESINSGLTVKEITEKFNITEANYSALIRKYNLSTPQRESMKKIASISREEIISMLNEGKTKKEITETLGIDLKSLNKILNSGFKKNI